MHRFPLFLAALLCLSASFAQTSNSTREQYATLGKQLREARAAKNWPAYLASAKRYAQLLNSSPESLIPLARAYVLNGDLSAANHAIQQFIVMGQTTDELRNSPDFAELRLQPDYFSLNESMKANGVRIALSAREFPLGALTGMIVEDVDYDPVNGNFFLTTVLGKKIFVASANGQLREFATSPDRLPLLGLKVDSSRKVLWATAVGLKDFAGVPQAAQQKSTILCFGLSSGDLLRRIDGPDENTFGDFAITSTGDLLLSDNAGGGIYLLPRTSSTLERLDHGEFISPQTPTISPDGNLAFIPDYARGVAILNRTTQEVRWLDSQGKYALSGIDGLYFTNGKLIATQNGSSPERVVLFTLDSTLSRIVSETVIERATETLGDPTHGVIVGKDFYYIANSGWGAFEDNGTPKPNAKLTTPLLMRFPMR